MSRKAKFENCKICGEKAKIYNWWTEDNKGQKYRYLKYIHNDGKIHYYRVKPSEQAIDRTNFQQLIEIFVKNKMGDKRLRFTELKKAIEEEYKLKINNQTFWRAIKRMINFNELIKSEERGKIFYSKGLGLSYSGLYNIDEMYVTFNLDYDLLFLIIKITNQSNKTEISIPITIPEGGISSPNEVLYGASYDVYGNLKNENFNIIFSYADETGMQINLNRALKRFEKDILLIGFKTRNRSAYRRLIMPLDISFIKVNVICNNKLNINSKKISIDYSRESKPDSAIVEKTSDGKFLYIFNYVNIKAKEIILIKFDG